MRCPNCDRENRDVARFCQYCGASLAATEAFDQEPHLLGMEPPSEQIPEPESSNPADSAETAPERLESISNHKGAESSSLPELDEPPEGLLDALPEEQDLGQELPEQRPATDQEPAQIMDEDMEAGAAEAIDTEVTPQRILPDTESAPSPTAEEQVPEHGRTDATSHVQNSDDLVSDRQTLQEPGRPSQDLVGAADESEGGDIQDEQGTYPGSDVPAELEPIPSEETSSGRSLEPEEISDLDEPLADIEELAAAGLLPWSDRTESAQTPFTPLAPGNVVDGRYQVIEVVKVEEREIWYSVRDLVRCTSCGSTDNSPDEAFCVSCGALLDQKPVAMMLERPAPGDKEPDKAEAADYVQFQDHHYWVWQEMKQKTRNGQPSMRMILGHSSDTGQVRELDEDSLFVLAMSSTYESATHRLGLFVVADGMGGHEGGEVASRIAIQCLAESLLRDVFAPELAGVTLAENAILDCLENAVHTANDRVYLERQKRENDMGTTITVALVMDWLLYLAHVGDCRAYRWGQEGLQQLTTDHSIVASMAAAGTIEPDEIYTHPQRSVIYRSIGDHPAVEVDLGTVDLNPDDRLVLCCDGLWEMIRSEGIEDVLLREADPQAACEIMVEQANRAGGSDNISVIIVQF
jgi:serine/threonine protein phosphatase PrpC